MTRRVVLQRQMWPEMYELLRGSGIMPRRSLREGATLADGETRDAAKVRVDIALIQAMQIMRMHVQLTGQLQRS
jgi:hypothetical protein